MWPFSKKSNLPGVKLTEGGAFAFDITEEEQQEIDKLFDLLKDYKVHPDFAEKLARGITARGLANYAADQIMMAGLSSQTNSREERIKKAFASIGKAYSIYVLPIYLYDLACCLEMMANGHDEAKNTFKLFLKRQYEYRPDQLDEIFMRGRDVGEATKDAVQKLRGWLPVKGPPIDRVFWEQKAFLVINTPLRFVSLAVKFVLEPIYRLMQLLRLPLLLLLIGMSFIWLILVEVIMFFSKISKSTPTLRPVSFVLALPFLLVADFLVTISPIPTPNDVESVMVKWRFIESFPHCSLEQ